MFTRMTLPIDQDAVHDDYLRRLYAHGLRHAVVLDKRIDRMFDRNVLLERLDVVHQHLGVECLRVVVVELRALLVSQFRMRLVVVIVAERYDVVALESLLQTLDEGRFS